MSGLIVIIFCFLRLDFVFLGIGGFVAIINQSFELILFLQQCHLQTRFDLFRQMHDLQRQDGNGPLVDNATEQDRINGSIVESLSFIPHPIQGFLRLWRHDRDALDATDVICPEYLLSNTASCSKIPRVH